MRHYTESKRSTVPQLVISAKCSLCEAKYSVKVKEKIQEKDSIVIFDVTRLKEHERHDQKKQNMRGLNRQKVVEDVILKSNGSSKNYVNLLDGAGVKDVPKEATIRKAVSQYLNKEMVSSCWITNTLSAVDSGENLIRGRNQNGKHINGYVQKFDVRELNVFELNFFGKNIFDSECFMQK